MRHAVVRILPYSPAQLLDLVGDVRAYPQFVPWITSMRVWNERTDDQGETLLDAEAGVGFSFLRERFSTRVRRDPAAGEITVSLLRGPFRKLFNRWRFSPQGAGTLVEFHIDFEFKSRLLQTLLAANFHQACDRLIGCFEERAKVLYGSTWCANDPRDLTAKASSSWGLCQGHVVHPDQPPEAIACAGQDRHAARSATDRRRRHGFSPQADVNMATWSRREQCFGDRAARPADRVLAIIDLHAYQGHQRSVQRRQIDAFLHHQQLNCSALTRATGVIAPIAAVPDPITFDGPSGTPRSSDPLQGPSSSRTVPNIPWPSGRYRPLMA